MTVGYLGTSHAWRKADGFYRAYRASYRLKPGFNDENREGVNQVSLFESKSVWNEKGAALSDKSARKEFGLTQEEIVEAIKAGKLQYRHNHIHGNPYLRLLRKEVESLVKEKYGGDHFDMKKNKNELSKINSELRKLKNQMASLEKRKAELLAILGE